MKILLSFISLSATVFGWGAPYIPGHTCNDAAYTVLVIAEEQPRTLLSWIKDCVAIDPTAMVEVGSMEILVHGKSMIVLPYVYYDCGIQPFLLCTPTELMEEAKAHRFVTSDGDGYTSPGMEYILKMYQPEDPKFKPDPLPAKTSLPDWPTVLQIATHYPPDGN